MSSFEEVHQHDATQEPELAFVRDTDGTVRVTATLRTTTLNRQLVTQAANITDVPTYQALSPAQKQAFRDTLVGIFQDLKTQRFPNP